jgi:hypothetical protein
MLFGRWLAVVRSFSIPFPIDGQNISAYLGSIGRSCSADENIPATEMYALQLLYNATNGDYWNGWDRPGAFRIKTRWNFTGFDGIEDTSFPNPCNSSWQGVSCLHNLTHDGTHLGCSVIAVDLAYMNLTGRLPSGLHTLVQLMFLELNFNNLTGSVPLDIYSISSLLYFNFYKNHLVGTIATEIGQLTNLMFIGLMENSMSGTLPSEIGLLREMREIYVYANSFSGPIPSSFGNLINCSTIDLYYNYLSYTIPSELSTLTRLFNFEVTSNHLSGEIPSFFGNELRQVKYLELSQNFFTGVIHSQLGNLEELAMLVLDYNLLTGTLFANFSKFANLNTFSITNNFISSTLPSSFVQMPNLVNMLLGGNSLTGNIDSLFASTSMESALLSLTSVVDISGNGFTGPIPLQLLVGRARTSVAMIKNCFHGSLSESVCTDSSLLKDVALDGLSAGDFCRQYTFAHVLSSYTSNLMTGSIPPCLFSIPSLNTLTLSGNGFSGTLPDCAVSNSGVTSSDAGSCRSPISGNFSVLIVSHNRIGGTIPHGFQSYPFDNLDLSYNRFSGTASNMSNFFNRQPGSQAQLSLQVNRLSGPIPQGFQDALNISMLDGNLFGCKNLNDLPTHDPSYQSAQCGSTQLYEIIAVYCFCFLLMVAILAYVIIRIPPTPLHFRYWHAGGKSFNEVIGKELSFHSRCDVNSDVLLKLDQQTKQQQQGDELEKRKISREYYPQSVIDSELKANSDFSDRQVSVSDLALERQANYKNNTNALRSFHDHLVGLKATWELSHWVIAHFPTELRKLIRVSEKYSTFLYWTRRFCAYVMLIIGTVFLGTYIGLKYADNDAYSTHTYNYGWLPSIAFVLGLTPGVVIAVEVMIAVIVLYFALTDMVNKMSLSTANVTSASPSKSSLSWSASVYSLSDALLGFDADSDSADASNASGARSKFWTKVLVRWREFMVIIFDMVIMVTANSLFLFASFSLQRDQLILVQLCLVFFKLTFNRCLLPMLLTRIYFHSWSGEFMIGNRSMRQFKGLALQTALIIFNNILAPCIAIFATDSTCFHNVLVNSPSISSSFDYEVCIYVNGITENCDLSEDLTVTTTFVPPFLYSFQCSSALLTTYVPVFLIMYGYIGFVSPLLDHWRQHCCEIGTLRDRPILKQYVLMMTPLIMKPIQYSLLCFVDSENDNNPSSDSASNGGSTSNKPVFASSKSTNSVQGNCIVDTDNGRSISADSLGSDWSDRSQVNEKSDTLIVSSNLPKSVNLQDLIDKSFEGRNSINDDNRVSRRSTAHKANKQHMSVESDFSDILQFTAIDAQRSKRRAVPHVFNAGNFTASMVCNLIILLTYGAGYPPLGFVVALSTILESIHMQYMLGRYWKRILLLPRGQAAEISTDQPPSKPSTTVSPSLLTRTDTEAGGERSANLPSDDKFTFSPTQLLLIRMLENSFLEATKAVTQVTLVILTVVGCFFGFFIFDMIGGSYKLSLGAKFDVNLVVPLLVAFFPFVVVGIGYVCRKLGLDESRCMRRTYQLLFVRPFRVFEQWATRDKDSMASDGPRESEMSSAVGSNGSVSISSPGSSEVGGKPPIPSYYRSSNLRFTLSSGYGLTMHQKPRQEGDPNTNFDISISSADNVSTLNAGEFSDSGHGGIGLLVMNPMSNRKSDVSVQDVTEC